MNGMLGALYGGLDVVVKDYFENILDHVENVPVPRRGFSKRIKHYRPPYYKIGNTIYTNRWGWDMLKKAIGEQQ